MQRSDNRKFCCTVIPFPLDKIRFRENIILVNNEKMTPDEVEVANTLNNFFSNIIKKN